MRRILVCTGVLGGGTALVFALAAATSMLFPQGTLVSTAGWGLNERFMKENAFPRGPAILDDVMVMPAVEAPAVAVPDPAP
jgi:hypothetical protein